MHDKKLKFCYFICVLFISILFASAHAVIAHGQERVSLTLETASGVVLYENRPVVLNINGTILPDADMPAIILQDRTFVPLRHVFESMGAIVDFHPTQRRIMIAYDNSLIVMYIGQYQFNRDTAVHQMDVAPQIINERTMVPVSFVASAMGFDVGWDESTFTVSLVSGQQPTQNTPNQGNQPGDTNTDNAHYLDSVATDDGQASDANFAELSIDRSAGRIPGETNLETTVNAINWTACHSQFIISASSRITMVDWFMLPDGRLIIDIIHARPDLQQSSFNIHNGTINTIRTGHNINDDGISVARVVFDLAAPAIYRVSLSFDRRHVTIEFEGNHVSNVNFVASPDATRESIVITGVVSPNVDIFSLVDPLRLVIDLPNTQLHMLDSIVANGRFVRDVRIGQFDATTTRVVLDLLQDVSFSVERVGNTVIVHLFEPTYQNITFDHATGAIEILKPIPLFAVAHLTTSDNYLQNQYIITLPGDFSTFFGYGTYVVRDSVVTGIEITTTDGVTQIIINTSRIMAFNLSENADTIFVRPVVPQELSSRIVLIDPGHGGRQPGAMHHGMREADVNLDVAMMVMFLLNRDGLVRAYSTRSEDITVPNSDRVDMANQIADIFVSIHFNAAGPASTGRAHGTEVLYTIASYEQGLHFNSRHMAALFQRNLVAALGTADRGLRHSPLIPMLRDTQMPAVLLEVAFLDNAQEAALIATQEFRWLVAQTIVDTIYEVFGVFTPRR